MDCVKFSIIIPVYNVESYLSDCLDSILLQNYTINRDYEVICVNDGSTDKSLDILNSYKNKGIKIINQTNSGVSVARNRGLEEAKGEYVWFVDSDDFISKETFNVLFRELESKSCDVLVFEFAHVDFSASYSNPGVVTRVKSQILPSRCIFKRRYILQHSIRFSHKIRYGEDTVFIFYIRLFNPSMIEINDILYYYRMNPNSAMHQKNNAQRHFDSMMEMLLEYRSALNKYGSDKQLDINNLKFRIYWTVQNVLFDALRSKTYKEQKELLKYLRSLNLYPYPLLWNRIAFNYGFKNFILNVFQLLFPLKYYYL